MLTKSDLQKIKQVTKEVVLEVGVTKEEAKNFVTKDELKNVVTGLREDIVKFKDEVVGEIKDLREEVAVVTGYKDTIEEHEDRISTLEEKSGISS